MANNPVRPILFVTGLSGAGKTTVLRTLEDIGWETVDNFPLRLAPALLELPPALGQGDTAPPIAFGFDSRTRGFDPDQLIQRIKTLADEGHSVSSLFLDCSGRELSRRFKETRRPHPLALDRPVEDGIAAERQLMEPLRRWSENLIDTTRLNREDLEQLTRKQFPVSSGTGTRIEISSFGFARGIPATADIVLDMRFLRNPHWEEALRPLTGLDQPVGDYVEGDEAFAPSLDRIVDMLLELLPRYTAQGKAYVDIAIGCTGGRHRSVFVAEKLSERLQAGGFSTSVRHRNLSSRPDDAIELFANGDGNRTKTSDQDGSADPQAQD